MVPFSIQLDESTTTFNEKLLLNKVNIFINQKIHEDFSFLKAKEYISLVDELFIDLRYYLMEKLTHLSNKIPI